MIFRLQALIYCWWTLKTFLGLHSSRRASSSRCPRSSVLRGLLRTLFKFNLIKLVPSKLIWLWNCLASQIKRVNSIQRLINQALQPPTSSSTRTKSASSRSSWTSNPMQSNSQSKPGTSRSFATMSEQQNLKPKRSVSLNILPNFQMMTEITRQSLAQDKVAPKI